MPKGETMQARLTALRGHLYALLIDSGFRNPKKYSGRQKLTFQEMSALLGCHRNSYTAWEAEVNGPPSSIMPLIERYEAATVAHGSWLAHVLGWGRWRDGLE